MKDRITSELESHRTVPPTKIKAFTIIQRMPNFINEIWPVVLMFIPPKNKQTKTRTRTHHNSLSGIGGYCMMRDSRVELAVLFNTTSGMAVLVEWSEQPHFQTFTNKMGMRLESRIRIGKTG